MHHTTPRLLDVVALLADLPSHDLRCGQVGTVVEVLEGVCDVDFSDDEGRTYAQAAVPAEHLLVLHYQPTHVA